MSGYSKSKIIQWNYSLNTVENDTILDTSEVKIIFEDVKFNGKKKGLLTVAGEKGKRGGGGNKTFSTFHEGSVCTITFKEYTLQITNSGRRLVFGEQKFSITGKKKTIIIKKDGTASISKP